MPCADAQTRCGSTHECYICAPDCEGRVVPGGLAARDEAFSLRSAIGSLAAVGAAIGHASNDFAATAVLVVLGPAQSRPVRHEQGRYACVCSMMVPMISSVLMQPASLEISSVARVQVNDYDKHKLLVYPHRSSNEMSCKATMPCIQAGACHAERYCEQMPELTAVPHGLIHLTCCYSPHDSAAHTKQVMSPLPVCWARATIQPTSERTKGKCAPLEQHSGDMQLDKHWFLGDNIDIEMGILQRETHSLPSCLSM